MKSLVFCADILVLVCFSLVLLQGRVADVAIGTDLHNKSQLHKLNTEHNC